MSSPQANQSYPPIADVDGWVKYLSKIQMPVFGQTIQLLAATSDEGADDEITEIILRDPAMTTKVMRMSNSSFYNPTGTTVTTVSRAIIVIGVAAIRSICVSVSLIDALLRGSARRRLYAQIAMALHGAVQAKSIYHMRTGKHNEDVFVATLLYGIGELAFWAHGGEMASRLDDILLLSKKSPDVVEREVLGFNLTELTKGLATEWKLGDTLESALSKKWDATESDTAIQLGRRIAQNAHLGWGSPTLSAAVRDACAFCDVEESEMKVRILESMNTAAADVAVFHAREMRTYFPNSIPEGYVVDDEEDGDLPIFDHDKQMASLSKLSGHLKGLGDSKDVFEDIASGLHEGVGMDRVLFALCSNGALKGAWVKEIKPSNLLENFVIDLEEDWGQLFKEVLDEKGEFWIDGHKSPLASYRNRKLNTIIGLGPFFVAPFVLPNKTKGILYVDRHQTLRELDEPSYAAFKLFVHALEMALQKVKH